MNIQLTTSGRRKGKQNAWRRMLSSVADKTLHIFPVPGLDVFLAKGFNPHQKGIAIAATPRHANVLLVTSPLPEKLVKYAANVYAQMPRPRLLVFVATNHVAPLPPPDFVLSADELNHLHQRIIFPDAWSGDALPYELPSTEDEGKSMYTCPMHPEVQSDKPGKCPKCGMFLVRQEPEKQSMNMSTNESDNHQHHEHMHKDSADEGKALYSCPMHPEVQSDKPGDCPKCGMTLVKQENKEQQVNMSEDKPVYTCPMHPEVQSDKPGKCPKCGMFLVKQDHDEQSMNMSTDESDKHQHHEHMQDNSVTEDKTIYTCPMHPEVQSDKPGDCPKCGMTLVKQESKEHQIDMPGGHQHEMKGHEGMGFMSMVQMTKDMPRSEDGLAMEMNDAFFGPFHLGLPGGLLVKMKLDGDSVVTANCKKGILSQHLLRHFPKEPEKLAKYLSQFNPLLHETYSLLLSKAFANATGRNDFADEVSVLEKDRIASHLNWLSVFSMTIGTRQLHYEASKLCYELQSQQAEKRNILKLTTKIKKTLYLKKRLSNIGIIPDDFIKQVSGPLARAAGMEQDVRSSQPAYQQRNFKPVVVQQNNAWGQLLVRLAEIEQSLELIDDETLHKESSVPEIWVNYNHNGEQNGEAALEAPNGRLHLKIQLKGGQVTNLSLQTASMAHAALVPEVTKGKELADALASIAALDISPWEMDV